MLSRLYSTRKDYLNVSNVDLYYTNNSQVYVGLFLFLIHFWYCEKKIFRSERLKQYSFDKIRCGILFIFFYFIFYFVSYLYPYRCLACLEDVAPVDLTRLAFRTLAASVA